MNRNDSPTLHPWLRLGGAHRTGGESVTPLGPQDLQKALERLCDLTGVTGPERHAVLTYRAITLNGKSIAFKMEEWSGFVKLFVDVGKPASDKERDVYRYLLEQQLYMPAPFSIAPAVHPESAHVVLCGCAPLPMTEDDDTVFLQVLQTCVAAAERLAELCLQ